MESLKLDKSALLVIDLQKGIVSRKTEPYPSSKVVANASKLIERFREAGLPVFLVHVNPGKDDRLDLITDETLGSSKPPDDWAEFVPEIKIKDSDIIITKKQWGAFYGTELELQLRRRKIETIVLCGIATNYGVESTARNAYELGYNQIFAEDAMTTFSREAHDVSVKHVFRRMGRVRKTEDILKSL